MIICLMGSTRFEELFRNKERELSLKGHTVFLPVFFNIKISREQKILLFKSFKKKIKLAHKIIVITKNNYIGNDTKLDIQYARSIGKMVYKEDFK